MNVEKTMENLKRNRMLPYWVKTKEEARAKVEELLQEGATVAVGGSVTLEQAGIIELLRSGRYRFLDRYAKGADVAGIFRASFSADAYLCSSNAVTEAGELFNVDGNGNRAAAMIFGPASVILVVGKNKLVKDLDEAKRRMRLITAPKNAQRLSLDTYCRTKGICAAADDEAFCAGCQSDARICCAYTVLGPQRIKDRIKVILVDEDLGY